MHPKMELPTRIAHKTLKRAINHKEGALIHPENTLRRYETPLHCFEQMKFKRQRFDRKEDQERQLNGKIVKQQPVRKPTRD